jgi:hypothetical protein
MVYLIGFSRFEEKDYYHIESGVKVAEMGILIKIVVCSVAYFLLFV